MNFDSFTEFYLTDLLTVICNFLAFLSTRKVKTTGSLTIIKLYIFLSFIFKTATYILGLFRASNQESPQVLFVLMNAYSLLECTLLFMFIRSEVKETRLKNPLGIIFAAFASFWFYILIAHRSFLVNSVSIMAGIESLTIVILSVISFNSVIRRQRMSTFLISPEFYIMMAIIGYFSYGILFFLSVPLVDYFLPKFIDGFESINLLLLSGYFLIIRKGFYALSEI